MIILREILGTTVLIHFVHDREPVYTIVNVSAPYRARNFTSSPATVSFWRRECVM
jgi:hypothetical protein